MTGAATLLHVLRGGNIFSAFRDGLQFEQLPEMTFASSVRLVRPMSTFILFAGPFHRMMMKVKGGRWGLTGTLKPV